MRKPTYFEEFVPFIFKGTIIVTIFLGIIVGVVSSFINFEIPSNSDFFTFSFGLTFIVFHIVYIKGGFVLLKDEIKYLNKELKRKDLEISLLKKQNITIKENKI